MKYYIKKYPDAFCEVFATFDKEEVEKEYKNNILKVQKTATYQGFRPGKVPLDIVEKNYPEEIEEKTLFSLVNSLIDTLLSKENIVFYGQPKFRPLSNLNKNNDFSLELSITTYPDVKNKIDFDNLELQYEEYYYDDKVIEKFIKKNISTLEEKKGKIEEGSIVTVKILNEDYENEDKEFIFEASEVSSLIGKKVGDVVNISFDDLGEYLDKFFTLKDKSVNCEILKNEVYKETELTDENVKASTNFNTLEEYKNYIAKLLSKLVDKENREKKIKVIADYIEKNVDIEFSKNIYMSKLNNILFSYLNDNLDVIEDPIKTLIDELDTKEIKELFQKAYKEAKMLAFILNYIKENNIQIDDNIYKKLIYERASEKNMNVNEFMKNMTENERYELDFSAKYETVINELLNKIKFKAKEKTPYFKL